MAPRKNKKTKKRAARRRPGTARGGNVAMGGSSVTNIHMNTSPVQFPTTIVHQRPPPQTTTQGTSTLPTTTSQGTSTSSPPRAPQGSTPRAPKHEIVPMQVDAPTPPRRAPMDVDPPHQRPVPMDVDPPHQRPVPMDTGPPSQRSVPVNAQLSRPPPISSKREPLLIHHLGEHPEDISRNRANSTNATPPATENGSEPARKYKLPKQQFKKHDWSDPGFHGMGGGAAGPRGQKSKVSEKSPDINPAPGAFQKGNPETPRIPRKPAFPFTNVYKNKPASAEVPPVPPPAPAEAPKPPATPRQRGRPPRSKSVPAKRRSDPRDPLGYYAALGANVGDTDAQIRRKYKLNALKFHPDKHRGNEKAKKAAEEQFKAMSSAKDVLFDKRYRKFYDTNGRAPRPGDEL